MSIRKRERKKVKTGYVFEVYFPYKKNGVRTIYRKSGFLTKSEAQSHEAVKKAELLKTGSIFKPSEKTLKEVYEEFLLIGGSEYQYNTIYNTQKTLNHWSGPKAKMDLGSIKIANIDYKTLQNYFNLRRECGKAVNEDIKQALRRIFIYAIRAGYIQTNPLEYVVVTGIRHTRKKHVLTVSEYEKILNELAKKNSFYYDAIAMAVKIAYYTGMRLSEVAALHKADFDMDQCTVFIQRKLNYKGLKNGQIYATDQMKSKKSRAVIPFPECFKNDLQKWFQINPYDYVICDEDGDYLNCDSVGNLLRGIAKKLNIEFHFHLLRHTYTTNLINGEVDVRVAQDLLRHSNFNTTMSIYAHVENQKKKNQMEKAFEKVFSANQKSVEKVSSLH